MPNIPYPDSLRISLRRDFPHNSSWWSTPLLSYPHIKESFLDVHMESPVFQVSIASCPGNTGKKNHSYIFLARSLLFWGIRVILSLVFPRPSSQSFFTRVMFQSLIHFNSEGKEHHHQLLATLFFMQTHDTVNPCCHKGMLLAYGPLLSSGYLMLSCLATSQLPTCTCSWVDFFWGEK